MAQASSTTPIPTSSTQYIPTLPQYTNDMPTPSPKQTTPTTPNHPHQNIPNRPPIYHQYQRRIKEPTTQPTPIPITPTSSQPDYNNPTKPPTNTHQMTTRSKTSHPILITNSSPTPKDPTTYKQAQPYLHWQQAMAEEIQALNTQHTWILVPKPPHQTILGSKWTYKTKLKPNGTVDRYKARLVAQGFRQTHGIDYEDTFSPVAKISTIRLFLILAFQKDWNIHQIDVSNAFLHGQLQETVYMHQPKGFEDPACPSHVCLLKKSLYGLKQSSRQWNATLTTFLKTKDFHSSSADPSLYIYDSPTTHIYILIYVDDILITGNNPQALTSIIHQLSTQFNIKHIGNPQVFLGIQTDRSTTGFLLHQQTYAESILHLAGLSSCQAVPTPLPSKDTSSHITTKPLSNPKLYRKIVGSLQYLVITRPDITHAVNQASQHMHDPQEHHFSILTRILRYIKGTSHYGIPITKGNYHLTAYTDSDWAGDPTNRTSTTGYCIFLGPNLLTWKTQKQRTVARSSSEAEYRALSSTITEVI